VHLANLLLVVEGPVEYLHLLSGKYVKTRIKDVTRTETETTYHEWV